MAPVCLLPLEIRADGTKAKRTRKRVDAPEKVCKGLRDKANAQDNTFS